jgi:hypothetical protein
MGVSRAVVVSAALILVTAMSVLPVEVAGAQTPSATVVIPASGAAVSGTSQVLDAAASSGVTQVKYEITGGTLSDWVIATATPTIYGWIALWNTTGVANGTYALQSVASSNGVSGSSPPDTIIVNNPTPSTTVIIPASGATMDTTKGVVWDAVASPGVTSVSFVSMANGVTQTNTAIPTIYGWVYVVSTPSQPCNGCIPYYFPITIQSVASYSGGVSGTSQPVNATIVFYLPDDIA